MILSGAISYIYEHQQIPEALAEKRSAVDLFQRILMLAKGLTTGTEQFRQTLTTSATYGLLLSEVILHGWEVLAFGYSGDRTGTYNHSAIAAAISAYDGARATYNSTLRALPDAATPFLDAYEGAFFESKKLMYSLGGSGMAQWRPGLGASVDKYRNLSTRVEEPQLF